MGAARRLQLVVPDLLPILARFTAPPDLPALSRLLARGGQYAGSPADSRQLLASLFGYPPGDVPVGAVARHGEGAEADDACWLCATPVHLLPQRDRVQLVVAEDVTPDEAVALAEEVNALYAAEGWCLEPWGRRLYLRAPGDCAFSAEPPEALQGRSINERLPEGPGRLAYHRFLTELEMLLHASAVNRAREARGAPLLGGLWLWGAGRLPEPGRAPAAAVYADDPFARGLARLAGIDAGPLPDGLDAITTSALVVLPPCPAGEPLGWLSGLERDWWAPLARALAKGDFRSVQLYAGCGRMTKIGRGSLWRIWRRQNLFTVARRLCG